MTFVCSQIIELAQNREFLDIVRKGYSNGPNINLLSQLSCYSDLEHFEQNLRSTNMLTFPRVFDSPLGYYLIKRFLISVESDDKAIFTSDVQLFKSLKDANARLKVAKHIYNQFIAEMSINHIRGISVFDTQPNQISIIKQKITLQTQRKQLQIQNTLPTKNATLTVIDAQIDSSVTRNTENSFTNSHSDARKWNSHTYEILDSQTLTVNNGINSRISNSEHAKNAIDIYGDCIQKLKEKILNNSSSNKNPTSSLFLFDEVLHKVLNNLQTDIFPRFLKSPLFKLYIQCKFLLETQNQTLTIDNFYTLRKLGRGAFGFVNACIKKDTGCVYAMKCINKKRVMATDSVDTIMAERDFLADMNSKFVTALKYAVMDGECLYLIMDLMVGGDLKFHLNKEIRFSITRSKFYAAEVLLGLQHLHRHGVIYRDIKLENVLLDNNGHCKISDLGLAVRCGSRTASVRAEPTSASRRNMFDVMSSDVGSGAGSRSGTLVSSTDYESEYEYHSNEKQKVRGYAGTPGYTAPEVCLQQPYDKCADFFSLGVMIYRFLSGRKPFQVRKSSNKKKDKKTDKKLGPVAGHHRSGNELDKNVVEIEPEYPMKYFTNSACSLLKGLMCKNVHNRLGAQRMKDIQEHAWFRTIDFGLLEAGYCPAPIAPNQDEINADSLRHIGKPTSDDKYKNVKITAQFERSLKAFNYVSMNALQEEMVSVLKKVNDNYSFERFTKEKYAGKRVSVSQLAGIPSMDELLRYHSSHSHLYSSASMSGHKPWKHRFRSNYHKLDDRRNGGKGQRFSLNNTRQSVNIEHSEETSSSSAMNLPLLPCGMDDMKEDQLLINSQNSMNGGFDEKESMNNNSKNNSLLEGEKIEQVRKLENLQSLAVENIDYEIDENVTNTNACTNCVIL